MVDQKTFRGFNKEELLQLQEFHNRMIRNLATEEDLDTLREMDQMDSASANNRVQSKQNGGN